METTFGPAFQAVHDETRILTQLDRVRNFMLRVPRYHTLAEIEKATGDPAASISAQLRHLRKVRFGSYVVYKRRRGMASRGLWEYRVFDPAPA
jgi:hypothetical protein